MKIGFDARLINSLGIGRYISGLLPPLAELLPNQLVVLCRSSELALLRAMTGGTARIVVSNALPYRLAEQSTHLLTLLRLNLALIHIPHYDVPIAYPRPFVVTIHDLFPFRFPEIHSGTAARITNQLLIANAVRRAAAIIVPSKSTGLELSQRFPRAAPRVTPIAEAAAEQFNPRRNLTAESSWQRYLGIRPPYFLYLGQWKPYKNVVLLVRAFQRVLSQRPDVQLVIAGGDPRYQEVSRAAEQLPPGSVVFPGHLPDDAVADVYRGSVALVFPSQAEGFGLPVLEAMACGVSVVCSDIPVLRELAEGIALFCDPRSAEDFARGMLAALDTGNQQAQIRGGIERAQQFSWQRAAEETVATYLRALAASRRSATE